ncbi:hypothetical protein FACS1894217_08970 [Clostridia bacterium]|nr:hypothetical protein FACS1894217_08970 [Clostridia bacterium]
MTKRRMAWPLVLILVIIITAALLFVASELFFRVESVEVYGAVTCDTGQVVQDSCIELGTLLPLINKVEAERFIRANQPYVDTVEIRRTFPHTVEIHITEVTPLAYIPHQRVNFLIDYRGKLLGLATPEEAETLPRIIGAELDAPVEGTALKFTVEGLDAALADLLSLLQARELLRDVTEIDLGLVRFSYLGRFMVELGVANDLELKLDYLPRVVEGLEGNARGTIDLSEVKDKIARFIPD